MGFDDGHRNRGLGLGLGGGEWFASVSLEFWLHLISEMGSEYFQDQPLIVGLIVFFPRGPKHRIRKE
jgi:hypothetical protein